MNKNTIIALVVAVLAVAGTVIFLWQYDKKQNTKPEPKPETPKTPETTVKTNPVTPSSVFPLKRGSKGAEVKALQRKINEWTSFNYFRLQAKPPHQSLSADGDFGPKTEANVKFVFGTNTVTQSQYNKFINQIIVPDTTPENPYLGDPLSFLNIF